MSNKNKSSAPRLVAALEFVSLAQRDKGAPYQTHVLLKDNMAVAYDGVLAAGHLIDEDINACPHTLTLAAALKKCKGALSVTQINNGKLSVRSGRFRAQINCSSDAVITATAPDPACGVIDNKLRDGLLAVSPLIVEASQRVVTASALLRSGSVLGTNGHMIFEYWHGIDLPDNLIIPKLFINALAKIKKNLVSFGFSETSLTVYFDDKSWLKTQLYNDVWADCDSILNKRFQPKPIPSGFFEGLDTVEPFVEDGRVFLRPGGIQTSQDDTVGASFEIPELNTDVVFNAKQLKLLDIGIKLIDFDGVDGISYFVGDNMRGVIAQSKLNQ